MPEEGRGLGRSVASFLGRALCCPPPPIQLSQVKCPGREVLCIPHGLCGASKVLPTLVISFYHSGPFPARNWSLCRLDPLSRLLIDPHT